MCYHCGRWWTRISGHCWVYPQIACQYVQLAVVAENEETGLQIIGTSDSKWFQFLSPFQWPSFFGYPFSIFCNHSPMKAWFNMIQRNEPSPPDAKFHIGHVLGITKFSPCNAAATNMIQVHQDSYDSETRDWKNIHRLSSMYMLRSVESFATRGCEERWKGDCSNCCHLPLKTSHPPTCWKDIDYSLPSIRSLFGASAGREMTQTPDVLAKPAISRISDDIWSRGWRFESWHKLTTHDPTVQERTRH